MPRVEAIVSTDIAESFRTAQARGMFDLPASKTSAERFSVEVPGVDEDWQIGLIVGPSGSGKSTIARKAFGNVCVAGGFDWPADGCVLDGFPADVGMREITAALAAVGFSSPPAWLRPYHVLSNGEKFRCDLARLLTQSDGRRELGDGSTLAVVDEFTSVVDRQVAKVGSAAIAKAVRGRNAGAPDSRLPSPVFKFVAVSCHYDIAEWLQPDWVVDMATCSLARGLLCRPKLEVAIHRCGKEIWPRFKRHHYLSGNLPCGCSFYVGLLAPSSLLPSPDSRLPSSAVAFAAVAPQMGYVGYRRFSRVVVLPDYQGIGVGGRFRDAVAEIEAARPEVRRLSLVTSHPAMIRSLARSPRWRCSGHGHSNGTFAGVHSRDGRGYSSRASATAGRIVVSFVYNARCAALPVNGYELSRER